MKKKLNWVKISWLIFVILSFIPGTFFLLTGNITLNEFAFAYGFVYGAILVFGIIFFLIYLGLKNLLRW